MWRCSRLCLASAGIKACVTTPSLAFLKSPKPSEFRSALLGAQGPSPSAPSSPATRDPLVLLGAGAALTHVSHPQAGRHPAPGRGPCGPVACARASLRSRDRRESAPAAPPAHTRPQRLAAPIRAFLRPVSSFRLAVGVAPRQARGVAPAGWGRGFDSGAGRPAGLRTEGKLGWSAAFFNKTTILL